ncbi:hypothetical protein VHUM_04136 [Vanrija humicola]|uniref:Brl1/Brr6 domain-containing protein n=1 Tax=Vanrija humicola TaxID=5417 RepID=A0A7D8YZC7_VANHU|nr:hypothetical protein VHUM_04136 [Vanrija humicola]
MAFRDRSGPMDVDASDPMARLSDYALRDDGPARKRMHVDGPGASPFISPSQIPGFRFGPNTPFLFHAPPLPPAPKFEPYDPTRWARTDFGFGQRAAAVAAEEDVDMSFTVGGGQDSPARPAAAGATAPATAATSAASTPERKIATGALTRVRRRRQEWARSGRQEHHYNFNIPAPAVRHSEIPAILLGYVQLVFNFSLVAFFLYVALQFILAVRRDVQERIDEVSVEILQEIAECSQLYLKNRCEPEFRVPAMENACYAWETCMNRDPAVVGRARVGAETFAGVINSFVDAISWKTMLFTVTTLSLLIVLTNSALFNLRAKHQAPPTPPQQQMHPPPHLPGMVYPPGYMPLHGGQAPHGGALPHQMAPHLQQPPAPEPSAVGKALGWFGKK